MNIKKALNSITDYVTEQTVDELLTKDEQTTFNYISSHPNLYIIDKNKAYVNKAEQKHQEQKVKVFVEAFYKNGKTKTNQKEIVVGPVVYKSINKTPVATYFFTWAMSYYKKLSKNYNKTKEIFPLNIKKGLDLIYYSFAKPENDGSLKIVDDSYLKEVKELKKHNTRVLLTIDGVGKETSQAFKEATSNQKNIDNFVKNIVDLVDFHSLDGVDIDWEPFNSGVVPKQLDEFLIALKKEFNKRQDPKGTPYILSAALPGGRYSLKPEWFNLKTLSEVLDYINFMTYDLNYHNKTSHLTPVRGSGISDLINFLNDNNIPLNKTIVGSGAYAKAYKIKNKHAKIPLNQEADLTFLREYEDYGSFKTGTLYISAIEEILKDNNYQQKSEYDSNGNFVGSYLYNEKTRVFITYESQQSVKEKVKLIRNYKGMGIMTWAYSQDPNNILLNKIIETRKTAK